MKTTLNPLQEQSCSQIGAYVHQFCVEMGSSSSFKVIFLNHPVIKNLENFSNQPVLQYETWLEAFTHSSFTHERSDISSKHYEKLEFLGDAILDTFVAEFLFEKMPHLKEGQMSRLRSALVNEESLAKLARFFNYDQCILMGKGETQRKTYATDSVLSDIFESVIAALYKEYGFEKSKDIFLKMIESYDSSQNEIFFDEKKLLIFDAKTRLQEKTMALYKLLPEYKALSCDNNQFLVKLYIDNQFITEVKGPSKKKAENQVAFLALKEELYLTGKGEQIC